MFTAGGVAGLMLALGAGGAIIAAVAVRGRWRRFAPLVAAGALVFQVVHVIEHGLQVAVWAGEPGARPWISPWAAETATGVGHWCSILAPASSPNPLGTELLHLYGNVIFLAGLVVLGPLLAALGQFGDDLPVDPPSVEADGVTWWWAPGAVLVALAFSVLLNLGRVFLQDWDLTLRAGPTSLRRTSGLLSRTSSASSIDRVQLLTTAQNPLQRHAGLRDVEVSTIGDGDLELVGLDDADVDEVRAAVGWGPERHLPLDRRVHPAEIWLATRNTTIVVGIAAGALGLVTGSGWAAVVLVVVPWKWWTTRRHVRNFRWSLTDALARTERVLRSAPAQAALHKANGVVVSQTIFERRRGLASVRLATAAGAIRIGMIPLGEAEAVRDVIVHAAETDRRPWM